MTIKFKVKKIVKNSYEQIKKISPNIKKKYSENLKVKGIRSNFDSVDIVTFFSFLEKNLTFSKIKYKQFLDTNFFFKFEQISIKDIIDIILKYNEKKN